MHIVKSGLGGSCILWQLLLQGPLNGSLRKWLFLGLAIKQVLLRVFAQIICPKQLQQDIRNQDTATLVSLAFGDAVVLFFCGLYTGFYNAGITQIPDDGNSWA